MNSRRNFIKRGLIWIPTIQILVPKLVAGPYLQHRRKVYRNVGGGGNSFTFVQSNTNSSGSGTTLGAQLTSVAAGNLIVVATGHYSAATVTMSCSDGTSSLTGTTQRNHVAGGRSIQFFYLLSANSGTKTYTVTFSATATLPRIVVIEYDYTGTCSFDQENWAESNGGTTALTTGNITASANAALIVCSHFNASAVDMTDAQIGGIAADRVITPATGDNIWDRAVTSGFGPGQGTGTANANWIAAIANFKAV
jgi:hypothetical protein